MSAFPCHTRRLAQGFLTYLLTVLVVSNVVVVFVVLGLLHR
jgi:hypothetical protein